MANFQLSTTVAIGTEALGMLEQYRGCKVLLVTDEHLVKLPVCQQIAAHFDQPVTCYDAVVPNPTIGQIAAGVTAYLEAEPELVIALGGGSVMDAAKAMHKSAAEVNRSAREGLIAIPTTSGSGSEVTAFSVLTDDAGHVKIPMQSPDMRPNIAILAPEAVVGCPAKVTADSGMDALTHAIEAYVSVGATDFSDAFAEKAAELVFGNLVTCYRKGTDVTARTRVHSAACMAAMAFDNAGLGITHSLAHALGGSFPIAHGRLNAVLLNAVIDFNALDARAAARYAVLAQRFGRDAATPTIGVRNLTTAISQMNRALGIPKRLTQLGIEPEALRDEMPSLVEQALADTCTQYNPRQPTAADLTELLQRVA
ncbi:MAG: alcohol dehydrogenase [Arachnia propionica]|nr:MAG: alcohol dehydrogenase [Arachnia propionica]